MNASVWLPDATDTFEAAKTMLMLAHSNDGYCKLRQPAYEVKSATIDMLFPGGMLGTVHVDNGVYVALMFEAQQVAEATASNKVKSRSNLARFPVITS